MALTDLSKLDSTSKLWIFASPAPIDPAIERKIEDAMTRFGSTWKSKGNEVHAAFEIRDGRFLIVAAEEAVMNSGCSMDKLFRTVRSLSAEIGIDLLDSTPVYWREGDQIRSSSRSEFRKLAESGQVGPGTLVYDITVDSIDELREGSWIRPAASSWHGEAFPLSEVS
ncbi:MAG: hypothetical protein ABR517_00855 [Thermoanaerobaculia bacterium]